MKSFSTPAVFILALCAMALALPAPAAAQYLPPASVDFLNTYGVRIDRDLTAVPEGRSVAGTVLDPAKLMKLGFKDVVMREHILLTNIGQGNWKLKLMSNGQEKTFQLK